MANDIGTKMVAAWNSGNVDRIAECYAPAAVMHHPLVPAPLEGREAIRGFETPMFAAFTELDWRVVSLVGSGRELGLEFQITARNMLSTARPPR